MKGIILAAGDGGRLRPFTLYTPKVLLEIGGIPLIQYPLDALRSAGISDIAVVVGHQAQKVLDALTETHPYLTFIYNEDYDGGNAVSVYAAASFVRDDRFVVCMGDHPIGPEIISRLLSYREDGCVLCVDPEASHPSQVSDATRVLVDTRGNIAAIGKHLRVWNAVDTGVFKMTADVFPAIEHLMEKKGVNVSITDVVTAMTERGHPFGACDVTGMSWADVDTLEDYLSIDRLMRERYGERV